MAGRFRGWIRRLVEPKAGSIVRAIGKAGTITPKTMARISQMEPAERSRLLLGIAAHPAAMSKYMQRIERLPQERKAAALNEFSAEAIAVLSKNRPLGKKPMELLNALSVRQLEPIFQKMTETKERKRFGRKYLSWRRKSGFGLGDNVEWVMRWMNAFSAK